MDELAVFTAGHNLARQGQANIDQLIWTQHWTPNPPGIWGRDDHLYTKKAPGISFITAPLIGLGHALPGLNVVHVGLLTNAIITALTAALLFMWLTDLGFSRAAATLTTLGYGLCTIAWVYARMFWESSMLALSFLVAVWTIYRATMPRYGPRQWLWLLGSGLAVAVGLTLRFETAPLILFMTIYLFLSRRSSAPTPHVLRTTHYVLRTTYHVSRPVTIYLIPSFFIGLGLLYFNLIRTGSLIETGYTQEILFREPWVGAFGLLFSPGRGLFIYAPFMILLFFGLRPAYGRLSRPYFGLIAITCLFYWLFYGSWFAWGGSWGWGPRFLLPILPLLMLFVAEPLEALCGQKPGAMNQPGASADRRFWAWSMVGVLAILSLMVNGLGIVVDFNEHFLRLGSNSNFVFNWAVFPPLAHWRILQEGLVDLIWLRPAPAGLRIEWAILTPALSLLVIATLNLIPKPLKNLTSAAETSIQRLSRSKIRGVRHPQMPNGAASEDAGSSKLDLVSLPKSYLTGHPPGIARYRSSIRPHPSGLRPYAVPFFLLLALSLTYSMMVKTADIPLMDRQAQLDLPVLETLAASVQPDEALLIPMPPFGDVQETSSMMLAYLEPALPTFIWIESEPRAIRIEERERVWQAAHAAADRVWLFERWLTQNDPTGITAARFNQAAFPIKEQWFEQSGKLTLYALVDETPTIGPRPLEVSFQGGLTLVDFAVFGDALAPGEIMKLRLTWRAPPASHLAELNLPAGEIIVFTQLLDEATPARNVAQNDRLLIDLQNFERSPLRPGQTVPQGYGLQLPDALAPGAYSLVVGLYQAASGQRLRRTDAPQDDFLYLTSLEVTP